MHKVLWLIIFAAGLPLALTACLSHDNGSGLTGRPQGTIARQTSAEAHPSSTATVETATVDAASATKEAVLATKAPVIATEEPAIFTEEPVVAMETNQPQVIQAGEDECEWNPTFVEDFEGDSLNTSRWDTGYKAGDQEAHYYVSDVFEVKDGVLKIRAEQRQVEDRKFASGILTTQGIFDQRYGRFEVSAKAPTGKGLWPAFWLLPRSQNYPWEIDVFEILGHEPDTAYMSSHWPDDSGNHASETRGFKGPDFSQDFHIFEIVWTSDQIVWLIDGVERNRETLHIPDEPMFLLLNLAVGGEWPGYPDDTTPFPSYLEVDFVRVYQWTCRPSLGE